MYFALGVQFEAFFSPLPLDYLVLILLPVPFPRKNVICIHKYRIAQQASGLSLKPCAWTWFGVFFFSFWFEMEMNLIT